METLLVASVAAAVSACDSGREPGGTSPQFSVAQFQQLRWLEGTWRGSESGRNPFYERYRFRTDTLVRIHYLADSTTRRVTDSGSVYLRAGTIYHEAGGGQWRAVRLDSTGIAFEPAQGGTNSFSWARDSSDGWTATLRSPGAPATIYGLERLSPDTGQAIAFLELLKSGEDDAARSRGFSVSRGGYWNSDRLLTFLDSTGVTFFDIDGDTTWHETVGRMRSKFARRSGMAFTMLVHLGHIYAQPEPEYSRLEFSEEAAGLVVSVGEWYRLTFVHRTPGLRVAKIEYVMPPS